MSDSTGSLITRVYSGFRGVDFRGEEINLVRSPDSLNVWKDYKETESIRTRPGTNLLTSFTYYPGEGRGINGLFFYNDSVIVHNDNALWEVKDGTKKRLDVNINGFQYVQRNRSHGFVYENKLYFMDGLSYLCYDGEKVTTIYSPNQAIPPQHCYVPTTSIGRKPSGGGTVHEDVNLLSEWRINTFVSDGKSTRYYLDTQNITAQLPEVTVNGNAKSDIVNMNSANGWIEFRTPPELPQTDGQDNVVIKFSKVVSGNAEKILGCTLSQVFDNRVFVTGNPNYPNMVWHCSLNDPTYFSDLDYYREGMDDAKITGMVAGNNALWVFREPSDANTTVFYHTPTIDEEYGKIYPSTHSSITMGCVGSAINFNDDIVFFSQRGMEGISGDVTTEQVVAHRSSLVDRKLLAESDYKNMILAEWEGYLMVFIGSKVYLADSRAVFTNENHIEYEWFYWEMGVPITYAKVYNGVLYLGTKYGQIYTLTNYESDVESYWVTPKDKFKYPHKLKTTNKRGCVAEATGDVSVYAKTDKTDFELIGTYEDVEDAFISRIKRKKFKDIQLKFHSKTRFSLETVTLECFIGGYIKR